MHGNDGAANRPTHRLKIAIAVGSVLALCLMYTQNSELGGSSSSSSSMSVFRVSSRGRSSVRTTATICNDKELDESLFKSQFGEDQELMKRFKNLCGGTYLEMGGLDGVRYSNSHVFNKGLDWKGVLVEASPRNYENLIVNRPQELATLHAGVCDKEQDLHWVEGKIVAVGGFLEFAADDFQKKWWTDELIANATQIKCQPLNVLLEDAVGHEFFFDFYSLDIEGGEFMALKSLDFTRYQFGTILLEADEHNERKNTATRTLLEANGYIFWGNIHRSYWFVNRDFDEIYADVIHG